MTAVGGIELHYYLNDEEHSMDARTRNRCEAELLELFHYVAATFSVPIQIDAQALREGGLRETWKWITDNDKPLMFLLGVVGLLVTVSIQVIETEEDALDKELKKLQIEELRRKLGYSEAKIGGDLINDAVGLLKSDSKINARKSNFYRILSNDEKVVSIGVSQLDENLKPVCSERVVDRDYFGGFILSTKLLPPLIIDDAKIQVISPVLRKGKFKWKGIYEGNVIGFRMNDKEFRNDVLNKHVTFQHGSFLDCEISISRKFDECGEVEITGYAVKRVFGKYDDVQNVQTRQGRVYSKARKINEDQGELFV